VLWSYSNANSCSKPNAYFNTYSYGCPHSHSHAHGDCDTYGDIDTDYYSDANSKRNSYTTTPPDTKASSNPTASSHAAPLG
jgi:hypothetical protein